MKKFLKIKILTAILVIFTAHIIFLTQPDRLAFASYNNPSEIVIEQGSKRILTGENYELKRPMASTTKILTAITVLENASLDDVVTVTAESVGVEGSSIYLKENEKITVRGLLYGLMLRSGNDAASALAIHVSGSIEKFAALMNQTAKKAGAENSNFTNPHGLQDENHYTTAYDLALITAYALDNEDFSEIVSTNFITIENSDGEKRYFKNKNKMLESFDGADGVKTGYTKAAGRCLVSSATRNGMRLVCVVLGCAPMFERSTELLTDCFNEYEINRFAEKGAPLGKLSFVNPLTDEQEICHFAADRCVALPIGRNETARVVYEVPESVSFSAKNGDLIGKMCVYAGNNLIYSENLYIIDKKNSYSFSDAFRGVLNHWTI